jgi:hypothetical protein
VKPVALLCVLLLSVSMASEVLARTSADGSNVLHDHWAIQSSAVVAENDITISLPGYAPKDWYPTSVPSTVLAALVANKVHPDPYYGNNHLELPGVRRWAINICCSNSTGGT